MVFGPDSVTSKPLCTFHSHRMRTRRVYKLYFVQWRAPHFQSIPDSFQTLSTILRKYFDFVFRSVGVSSMVRDGKWEAERQELDENAEMRISERKIKNR